MGIPDKTEQWLVVLNPNAGGRLAEREWPKISNELKRQGFKFEVVTTKRPLHALKLVDRKIGEGFRKIIAIGGDGTLHEVVNGMMKQQHVTPDKLLLALISVGTGNDWIKTHNISPHFKEAIQQIKTGQTIVQDVGKIEYLNGDASSKTRYFVNSVGIGFDAQVVKYTLKNREKGKTNKSMYFSGLVRTLFSNRNVKGLLHLDNEPIETKIYNLSVGVCRFKGGGFKMLPNAVPDDGKLDVTLASRISKRKLLSSLPKLFSGHVDKIKYFDFYQVKELVLDIPTPLCTEADGEFLGYHPLRISIIPNQLRLISAFHSKETTETK